MKLFFITNSAELAQFAIAHGVDRIFVDLEILGKVERQGHLNTVISRHSLADVASLRAVVPAGRLLVRINPIHDGSVDEIERVIASGADILMLPMFRTPREVEAFTTAVAGRVRTCLLVETVGAMESLRACVSIPGVDEVHIGLNDLHLEMGKRFMFEPLVDGHIDRMARILNELQIPFGIGGVARVGEGTLPAERILAEHARLGSTAAILSRTFHRQAPNAAAIQAEMDFGAEVANLRAVYQDYLGATAEQLQREHDEVCAIVRQLVGTSASKV